MAAGGYRLFIVFCRQLRPVTPSSNNRDYHGVVNTTTTLPTRSLTITRITVAIDCRGPTDVSTMYCVRNVVFTFHDRQRNVCCRRHRRRRRRRRAGLVQYAVVCATSRFRVVDVGAESNDARRAHLKRCKIRVPRDTTRSAGQRRCSWRFVRIIIFNKRTQIYLLRIHCTRFDSARFDNVERGIFPFPSFCNGRTYFFCLLSSPVYCYRLSFSFSSYHEGSEVLALF